ncbi:hypothetical protein [Profundibacter sp.]
MKRKGLLALTGCDAKRFETLQRREQLPIVSGGRWTEYHLRDAFAVRLTLDLIGGESDLLCGVPPSCAGKYVSNALCEARGKGYDTLGDLVVNRIFLGTVIFQSRHEADGGLRFTRWFAGPAERLGAWIAETGNEENAVPVRVLLADAGRVALHVIEQARELGICENAEGEPV